MSKLTIGKVVAGLDLGDRFSWLCVLDAEGAVIEEARVQTTERAFRSWFSGRGAIRVALEVGTHSPWVSRLLAGMGHEVIVANARHVRLIYDGDRKSDRLDAEALARSAGGRQIRRPQGATLQQRRVPPDRGNSNPRSPESGSRAPALHARADHPGDPRL